MDEEMGRKPSLHVNNPTYICLVEKVLLNGVIHTDARDLLLTENTTIETIANYWLKSEISFQERIVTN